MRINFANYFMAAGVMGGLLAYLYLEEHSIYVLVGTLLLTSFSFVFAPQINWWWYKNRPPALEAGILAALERHVPFYQRLDEQGKTRFRGRLALIRMATDWNRHTLPNPDGSPREVPDKKIEADLQSAISAQQVAVTWAKEHFLFERYEKVIITPSHFLSPNHPFSHHSEVNDVEDPCIMLSAESVLASFLAPDQHFNVALYEYARIYLRTWPAHVLPKVGEADWPALEAISGWSKVQVEAATGVPGADAQAVVIHHFFVWYEQMRALTPEWFSACEREFLGVQ
jgi:hypothetical protein